MNRHVVRAIFLGLLTLNLCIGTSAQNSADTGKPGTFYNDVLPILQERCQVCHRGGGGNFGGMIAPMAFTDYADVRPWAKAIAKNVSAGEMPPWHADPQHAGEFENERTITREEIDTLVDWVQAGAPRGNPADAPPEKEWPSFEGWQMGKPDLIVKMPEPFLVEDDVEDLYQTFFTHITKEMLPEPRWIKTSETRPGSGAVHHIVAHPIGGLVPGGDPKSYPEGVGVLLMPDTTVYWSVHYHKEAGAGTAVWDQSEIALEFYPNDVDVTHILRTAGCFNYTFKIPAGDPAYEVFAEFTFKEDANIINYMPHMHLRGSAAKFEAFYPDGRTEVLLNIPKYDFNWQTTYQYKEFKFVPKGTRIKLTSVFDNSPENPSNPDPTVDVTFGEPTTAEMVKSPIEYIRAVESEDIDAYVTQQRQSKNKRSGKSKKKIGDAKAALKK